MIGDTIQCIYYPNNEADWILIRTDQGFYSMRLGGFRKETEFHSVANYEEDASPYRNSRVKEIYTDDEWVYLVLTDGNVIASGWTDLLGDEMKLGIKFTNLDDYEADFFQLSIFRKLITGEDNWSKSL